MKFKSRIFGGLLALLSVLSSDAEEKSFKQFEEMRDDERGAKESTNYWFLTGDTSTAPSLKKGEVYCLKEEFPGIKLGDNFYTRSGEIRIAHDNFHLKNMGKVQPTSKEESFKAGLEGRFDTQGKMQIRIELQGNQNFVNFYEKVGAKIEGRYLLGENENSSIPGKVITETPWTRGDAISTKSAVIEGNAVYFRVGEGNYWVSTDLTNMLFMTLTPLNANVNKQKKRSEELYESFGKKK